MSYSDTSGLLLIDVHALPDEFMLADGLGIEVRAQPQALHMLFLIDVPYWLLGQSGFALAAALNVQAQRCLVGREHDHMLPPPRNKILTYHCCAWVAARWPESATITESTVLPCEA
jgi:hypothetical protein